MKVISLFLGLVMLLSLSSCNSSDKLAATGEGVYGDYVVVSIDDYMDMIAGYVEIKVRLELHQKFLADYQDWIDTEAYLKAKIETLYKEWSMLEDTIDEAYKLGMLTDDDMLILEQFYQELQERQK